jgi:asparagine synthase (glutamine-hydrolysing)
MCGIAGVWGKRPRGCLSSMVKAMHHRGPDDHGLFEDENIALGMTRLAVIDLSPRGHQPMANRQQTVWIAYNGEVYNFRSERALLESKGFTFQSSSDTEVLLHMYEEYGDDFVLRLRGMFALAIYDGRRGTGKERLLLARDHLGIKPLLYSHVGGRLVFASEMKALLASGLIPRDLDPIALRLLLTFGSVYQPRTLLRGVHMLLPGQRLVIDSTGERVERYWALGVDRVAWLRDAPYETQVEYLRDVLKESVRLQLVGDVPLGAFLSGGVDSSLLVALMSQQMSSRVKTFSVGYEAEGAAMDESADALRTARFLGTEHTHVLVKGDDVADRIHHIAAALDQPSVDGVNSYFVSLAARRDVTVAVSGTGGDEIFGGYPFFVQMALHQRAAAAEPRWKATAKSAAANLLRTPALDSLFLHRPPSRLSRLRDSYGFLPRYLTCYNIFGPLGASALISPELQRAAQAGRAVVHDLSPVDELSHGSVFERVSGLCLRGYTSNQLLRDIDAVSMAHSLEVRVPFLDPVVVDAALSLPDSAKVRHMTDAYEPAHTTYRDSGAKRILLDVSVALLPKNFDLQPKRGFSMPFGVWLKGPLRSVLDDTLSDRSIAHRGILQPHAVDLVKRKFSEGESGWAQPWLLMMLELWCREVLDPQRGRPGAQVDNLALSGCTS